MSGSPKRCIPPDRHRPGSAAPGERSDRDARSLRRRAARSMRISFQSLPEAAPTASRMGCAVVLFFILGLVSPAPASADVLSWLNRKIDGLLSEGKGEPDINPEVDRYLKMLAAGRVGFEQGPARPAEAAQPYRPRLSEALKEVIPEGGDRETTFFYQNAYLLGVLAGQLGFRTPLRVVGHLGEGIEPGVQLLIRILEEFKKNPEGATVARLHQVVERAMAQVQTTHQMMVECRELLETAHAQVRRTVEMVDRLVSEEGRLQSYPVVLGLTQTVRKSADNLAASLTTLSSSVTHFKTAFSALRMELSDLDSVTASQPWMSADRVTLKNRPDRIRTFGVNVTRAHAALKEATVVVRTNLGLIRLNHQGLMQVLATLNSSPLAQQRRATGAIEDGGAWEAASSDRPPALNRVNPALHEAVARLAALGRDIDSRRSRLEETALALRAFRPQPLVIEDLPDWVFEDSSLPRKDDKWNDYSLLPEKETEVEALLSTLEKDLKVGASPEEMVRQSRERRRLDDALDDREPGRRAPSVPAPEIAGQKAVPPEESSPQQALESSGPDQVPSIGVTGSGMATPVTSAPPAARSPGGYDLPDWY